MAASGSSRSVERRTLFYLVAWTFVMMDGISLCTAAYDPFIFSFTRHSYNATIAENVRGRAFVTPDEKMGIMMADPTLEVKYKITSGDNEKFFKAESKLVGDFCFLLIRTHTGNNDVLNRERRDEYVLQVRATIKSRGQHKFNLRAKTQVRVTVLDTNDLSPLFHPNDYEVQVAEDAPLHRSVVRVSASDADIGINGEVYYSLDPNFLVRSNQFAIHPTSGVVTLTRPLSHHDKPVHDFSVLAHDRGPKTTSANARAAHVRVNVRQVNLHDPVIFVQHLSSVVEDSNVDVYAIVKVTDEDDGVHGEIGDVEIVSGDDDGLFRMQKASRPHEYNIVVLSFLDREVAPYGYNLTIAATDNGSPPRSTTKLVKVRVTDLNDHAPQFPRSKYETTVEELAPVGTPVLRVSATDTDVGRNALVRYRIVAGNNDGSFVVDANTGVLKVAKRLDAETKKEYELTLMATDQGNNGMRKNSTTRVSVSVSDNNDEDPVFVTSSSEVTLSENEPAGTAVFTARAVDSDQGENGYVSYSIANLSPTPFSIDHFTGEIRTREQLDYETQRRTYLLKVRASDWGSPYRRQTEMTLRVNVRDVNDNRPQFEKVDCVGQLYRRAPIRTPILTLSAVDFDSGNIITYLVVSGNEDRCFDLDPSSGLVSLACSLDDVRAKERFLNVTATDGLNFADEMAVKMTLVNRQTVAFQCRDVGVVAHLKEQLVLSEKNNQGDQEDQIAQMPIRYGANRHQPRFAPERFDLPAAFRVNESAPVGHKIAIVKAVDRDLGYNGQVVYVISDGDVDGCFQMDTYGGALRVSAPLDRERRSVYRLNVTAWDLGRPQRGSWRAVEVEIDDVNDNPPVFDKAVHSVTVSEGVVNGSVVVRLRATDKDIGRNARVTYSLFTDTEDFAVDPVEGTVKVTSKLDREKQEVYELRVKATDGGLERAMSAIAVVRVKLTDVNDNAPKFAMEQYTTRIREDVPQGAILIALWARDPDLGAGGHVTYSLPDVSSDPDLPFEVDPDFGVIRVTKGLDFESRQMYNLSVRARDEGSPPMESMTHVLVEVMDVNENQQSPIFDDFVLMGRVAENKSPGTFVMQVEARDEDDPWSNNGMVVYSIRDGDGLGRFVIDEQGEEFIVI
uniref:Cadherin domain-containing protein n=1 Tax=Strigamia maritima TaxID=126957 RepID=T1J1P2_STRMM